MLFAYSNNVDAQLKFECEAFLNLSNIPGKEIFHDTTNLDPATGSSVPLWSKEKSKVGYGIGITGRYIIEKKLALNLRTRIERIKEHIEITGEYFIAPNAGIDYYRYDHIRMTFNAGADYCIYKKLIVGVECGISVFKKTKLITVAENGDEMKHTERQLENQIQVYPGAYCRYSINRISPFLGFELYRKEHYLFRSGVTYSFRT